MVNGLLDFCIADAEKPGGRRVVGPDSAQNKYPIGCTKATKVPRLSVLRLLWAHGPSEMCPESPHYLPCPGGDPSTSVSKGCRIRQEPYVSEFGRQPFLADSGPCQRRLLSIPRCACRTSGCHEKHRPCSNRRSLNLHTRTMEDRKWSGMFSLNSLQHLAHQ